MQQIILMLGFIFSSVTFLYPSSGALDTSFNSPTGYIVTDISGASSTDIGWSTAVQPDGKVVVVGQDSTNGTLALVRYTIAGALDAEFGTGGKVSTNFALTSATGRAVTVLPNGKIIAVGMANDGGEKYLIAQFLADGTLDTAGFAGGAGYVVGNVNIGSLDIANAIVVDASGKIYVAGTSDQSGAADDINIFVARYTSAGVLDTTYNSDSLVGGGGAGVTQAGIALVSISAKLIVGYGVALDSNGKIVVVGANVTDGYLLVARLTSGTGAGSGILDTTFDTDGIATSNLGGAAGVAAYTVAFQSTDKIIIGGVTSTHAAIARFTTAGALDTTFGVASSGYNITSGDAQTARGLVVQQDDKIVIAGTSSNDFIIARYAADGSALDGTFGTSGQTTTSLGAADTANFMAIQQNGRFVVTGTSADDFGTARYLGEADIQGCMDVSYRSSTTPGFRTYPTDATSTNEPQVKALQALHNNKLYVVTENTAGTTKSQIVQLNADGSDAIAAVDIAQIGAADVIVDSQQRAVVVGTNGTPRGWLYRSTSSTSLTPSFTTFAEVNSSSFVRVAEQAAGRILVIGQSSTAANGLLIAYNENGVLADSNQTVCAAFGAGGVGTETGFITLTNATFNDLLIGSDDKIYVAYEVAAGNISIAKYLADGSALDTAFDTDGIVDTGWAVAGYGVPCLTFDTSGNVIIAAIEDATGDIKFKKYNPSTGAETSSGSITQATSLLSTPVLTKLQCDTDNRFVFTGYDTNLFFVGRCGAGAYTLDTTFAPYSSAPGILKTAYNDNNPTDNTTPKRVSNGVCINNLGNILFGGYENIDINETVSVVGQVVGDTTPAATQVARYPGAEYVGTLQLSFGTDGALDLTASPASLSDGQPKVIYTLASGKMLVTSADGTDTSLALLDTSYSLDTGSFGSGTGKLALSGLVTPTSIISGFDGATTYYYVVGMNGSPNGVIYKVPTNGASGGTVLATTTLTQAYAVAQQASGRILVAGYDSSNNSGVIVAYTPAGAIDTSFNAQLTGVTPSAASNTVSGYWYTNVARPVTSISVGTQATVADKIYFAYQNGAGSAIVDRLLENGTALDSNFTFGTAIASVSSETQIKMQLDTNGKIVLAANTGATAGIRAARYTAAGANDVASATIITNAGGQELTNILCLTDGSTLILGAIPNATASSAFINLAMLNTSFALDTTFNANGATPGILSTNAPSSLYTPVMKDFYTIDVAPTSGILVAGDDNQTAASANPYFAKVYTTSALTKVSQTATALGAAGTLDTTFNPAGTNAGFMNLEAELPTDFPSFSVGARILLQKSDGSYYIASDGGSDSYITLLSQDDVQNSSFGTSGLLSLVSRPAISGMLLAQNGTLVVVGGNGISGSNAGWLQYRNASTGAAVSGFTAPSGAGNVLDAHYAVAQQSNGRILVAGIKAGVGSLIAYNSVTGAVDTTFATNGTYTATGYTAIHAILVNSSDEIYFIANNSPGDNARVIKLTVNGTGAAVGWTIPTVSTNSTVPSNNKLAFNQAHDVVAVAVNVNATPDVIAIKSYNPSTGAEVTAMSLSNITEGSIPADLRITSALVDLNTSPGKVILTGYNNAVSPFTPFILRTTADEATGLDTTFNTTGVQAGYGSGTITGTAGALWYTSMINANGKITVGGYERISGQTVSYLMRIYGDDFKGQYLPSVSAGTPGTIDANFGISGYLDLGALNVALSGATAQVVVPTSTGQYYVTFTNGQLIRLTNAAALDTTYGGGDGIAATSTAGVYSMILDGSSRLVLAGTNAGAGWINRYVSGNSGALDTTFDTDGIVNIADSTAATVLVQQTLGRYVVAGIRTGGNGALFAYTSDGIVDTTFNSTVTPGYYDTGVASGLYAVIADTYDRLIIAYKNGTAIDLRRLTSAGQLDTTFGTAGTIAGAIANADQVTQVRLAFDASGNIVVVAHINDGADKIAVKAYANSTGSSVVETEYDITGLTSPTLTQLITTADSKVLVAGYQSGSNAMWVARIEDNGSGAYIADTDFGGGDGIMTFSFSGAGTVTNRNVNSIALYGDGQIAMVGIESDSADTPNITPFLSMAYDNPYTTQTAIAQNSKPIGTNDTTFGASSTTATNLGVTFFASATANAASGQVARAVALQDDAHILVAVDGGSAAGSATPSNIFLKMFGIDGVADATFGTSGQQTVLTTYQNQFVKDMVTFTTVAGVHKAILAGYVTNSTLSSTSSLLLQYNLDTHLLDSSFGGFDGDAAGIAFGDGKQLFAVGQQSSGRIIGSGVSQDNLGLLLGYTSAGKLDSSFGNNGYLLQSDATGINTHAIDTQNRICIGYKDADNQAIIARVLSDGSALDTSFNTTGAVNTLQTTYSNDGIRVAVDASNNVYAAVVADNYASVTLYAYNGTNGTALYAAFTPSLSLTHFEISKLLVDVDGNVTIVGYDTNGGSADQIIIARVLADLSALDTSFNTTGAIPGCLKYAVAAGTTQATTDALIHPDGRIIIVGSEN